MSLIDVTPEVESVLRNGPLDYGWIVDVFLDTGIRHYWNHYHSLIVDDGTGPLVYMPVGDRLIAPDDVSEEQSLDGETLDLRFDSSRSSDNSDFLGGLLDEELTQRRVRLRRVLFRPGTNKTVPIWLFDEQNGVIDGFSDTVQVGEPSILTMRIQSGTFAYLERRNWTFSDADQQTLYPGDTGFERLAQLIDIKLPWAGEF